jgi:hypothetical protein
MAKEELVPYNRELEEAAGRRELTLHTKDLVSPGRIRNHNRYDISTRADDSKLMQVPDAVDVCVFTGHPCCHH